MYTCANLLPTTLIDVASTLEQRSSEWEEGQASPRCVLHARPFDPQPASLLFSSRSPPPSPLLSLSHFLAPLLISKPARRSISSSHNHPPLLPGHLLERLPALPPVPFLLSFLQIVSNHHDHPGLDGEMPPRDVVDPRSGGDEGGVERGGGGWGEEGSVDEGAGEGGDEEGGAGGREGKRVREGNKAKAGKERNKR